MTEQESVWMIIVSAEIGMPLLASTSLSSSCVTLLELLPLCASLCPLCVKWGWVLSLGTSILASDWLRMITWPGYWPLIGWVLFPGDIRAQSEVQSLNIYKRRVWDYNWIDTQLHYNNHNYIMSWNMESMWLTSSVEFLIICNVNVAGAVLSTSLCQHRGGKAPCANTDNVEQCL